MTSNRSLGVNPFFLKRQHEAAAKELANSGSNISISSKKFARNEEHSQKVPAQKSIPEVSTIDTGRVRPDPRLTTPTPPPSSAAPALPAAAATLPCPALGLNHQMSHSHQPLPSTPLPQTMLRINGSILDLNGLGPYTVELNWAINNTGITLPDVHSLDIPINPTIYDTPVGDSLPYHHNNNIFLAKTNCTTNCRKFLWICTTTKDMFWLVGYVPKKLSTWRESMLRHSMYVLTIPNRILSTDEDGTVLLRIAKQIGSLTPTMEDIRDQNTQIGGLKRHRKCVLMVDCSSTTPQLQGLKWIAGVNLKILPSGQKVYEPLQQNVKMGEGCLANAPSTPLSISVSQVCQAIQSLDGAAQPAPHFGPVKMTEAMMDIDCALFAMTANTIKMSAASSAESVIKLLKNTVSFVDQSSITNFIPSGEWQVKHNSGPTIRPINGGYWWLLPSPQVSKEPFKCWIHSKEFFNIKKLKLEAILIAGALFDEIDPNNPERSTKLLEKNTSDELKVPGGFMFPLCLGVMASRQGTHVTIFLETYSNKSHGMKLDAIDKDYDSFGTQNWASQVTTSFSAKWNTSILHMFTHLTDEKLGCFQLKHELTSVGFGFSSSYSDSNNVPLFSVCKRAEWMTSDGYESFCALALHSTTSNHTTHFKSEPMLRVQAYIEEINCISDRQCGVKNSRYARIGLSAAEKISSGEINVSAMLQGFNEDFNRINQAFKTMQRQPRNRTEIQVRCIVDETGKLQLRSMIQVAANIILQSTLHYQLNHVLSYSSLNVAAMFLISQQSWRLACDAHVPLKQRQLLLDIANEVLKRWKSFKSGRGEGTKGSRNNRILIAFPELVEPLTSKLNSMLPHEKAKTFRNKDDQIQSFTHNDIICDDSFGAIMNKRIQQNKNIKQSNVLSRFIMKCCTCNKLFYGASNREALDCHLLENPSCVTSKWKETQLVSAADWELDYSRKLCEYEEFLKTCSTEQKAACESVLTFGTGVFAVGIAGAGKSVALNMIGTILECVFYEHGEVLRCASTGLLAQYFHPSAKTIHSAIGAYPPFGQSTPSWNLSVSQWRELIQQHGKVDHKLKVFINTEVYAQSSNMLKAFLEIRKEKKLNFVAIIDGDPPQPMHEDDISENLRIGPEKPVMSKNRKPFL